MRNCKNLVIKNQLKHSNSRKSSTMLTIIIFLNSPLSKQFSKLRHYKQILYPPNPHYLAFHIATSKLSTQNHHKHCSGIRKGISIMHYGLSTISSLLNVEFIYTPILVTFA